MYGDKMAGGGEMGGYSMGGGEEKNVMEMKSGYGGSEMKGDNQQKNAEEKPADAGAAAADVSIMAIWKHKGGDAPKEQIAEPAMAKGATHTVCNPLCDLYSMLIPLLRSWLEAMPAWSSLQIRSMLLQATWWNSLSWLPTTL